MNTMKDIILNSLKYYDTNTEKYFKYFEKAKYCSFIKTNEQNELDHNVIVFYDDNKKEIFKSRYEILGYYNANVKFWTWGWAIAGKKNEMILSRKLLNYALDLDDSLQFLKRELTTSRFRISSEIQLDIHAAIASYISKNPLIFKLISPYTKYTLESNPNTEIIKISNVISNVSEIYYLYLLDENNLIVT